MKRKSNQCLLCEAISHPRFIPPLLIHAVTLGVFCEIEVYEKNTKTQGMLGVSSIGK